MSKEARTTGPGIFARILLAFFIPWKILFDRAFAEQVEQLAGGEPASALPPAGPALIAHHMEEKKEEAEGDEEQAPPSVSEMSTKTDPTAALLILGILQRDGRLLDFLQEDIAGASDGDVGAAARVVHEGCRKALLEYVELKPVISKEEGEPVTIEPEFDAGRIRLTGNIVGKPPFQGRLAHPGWLASRLDLPSLSKEMDPTVVAPAEVEI